MQALLKAHVSQELSAFRSEQVFESRTRSEWNHRNENAAVGSIRLQARGKWISGTKRKWISGTKRKWISGTKRKWISGTKRNIFTSEIQTREFFTNKFRGTDDFKNIFAKNFVIFFPQTTDSFFGKNYRSTGFWEKRRKLEKIAENCDHNIDPRSLSK
jgi:hypothetical protein